MNKKKKIILLLLLVLTSFFIACSTYNKKSIPESEKNIIKDTEVNIPNKKEIIEKLSSDEFEGRFIKNNGNKLAGEYIYNIFSNLKLQSFLKTNYYHIYSYEDTADNDTTIKIKREASNIIGKISGKESKNAIIISAHFDHIGIQSGKLIRGALDNASGVSVLISLADKLKKESSRNSFPYDIIFAAFNGEEVGLTGSKSFVTEISGVYDKLYNINIDSVGYKDGEDIVLNHSFNKLHGKSNSSSDYDKLYNNLKKYFEINNLTTSKVSQAYLSSDDYSFQEKGYTSIGIIEKNVKKIIHTTNDIPEIIDYNKLELIEKSIYDFVVGSGDCLFK